MGSSRAIVCAAAAFLLISLGSASTDEHFTDEQREITFDLDKESHLQEPIMQREVDLSELINPMDFQIEQVMVHPPEQTDAMRDRGVSRTRGLTPRGRQPSFGPRSFLPILDYPVQFPLGRPTSDNLQAICLHGDHRPRYPDSYFPRSGFGSQKRRANAVNMAESWLSMCCQGLQTSGADVTLCCATQAWELSVSSFCEADSSVKDRLYHCCRKKGGERLNCFNNDSPNPNYAATEELPVLPLPSTADFHFNPNTCQRTAMTQHIVRGFRGKEKKPLTSQKVDIRFPPGRPTATSIESLCRDQKLRPLYAIKCLPYVGYEWLAHQAKTINRMEKGFRQCCKKKQGVLVCAEQKWREELNKFCSHKGSDQTGTQCCSAGGADDQLSCFQNTSVDPHYNSTSATKELSLNNICDTHKIIKKKFPVGFPIKTFVDKCCPLSPQDQTACFVQRLEEISEKLCTSKKAAVPAIRRCCRVTPQEPQQCISKILMDAITKATNVLRKKKKRCPIS